MDTDMHKDMDTDTPTDMDTDTDRDKDSDTDTDREMDTNIDIDMDPKEIYAVEYDAPGNLFRGGIVPRRNLFTGI
jgi:hypothetical protein